MGNPNVAFVGQATQFKPGNKLGGKPKGVKHVSTWVNEMLNDEEFTVENFLGQGKTYKGAPMKAIVKVATYQALSGDVQWAKWLTDNATKLDRIMPDGATINFNQITIDQKDKYDI